jgi:hypothetical protein
MKKYKQKEVAKMEGVEVRQIIRWDKDPQELKDRGWTKHGEGNGCYYTREQDTELPTDSKYELQIKKLKAEIAEKEQKIERNRKLQAQEWSDAYTEMFMDAFLPLKDILSSSRFDEENFNKWNGAINECLTNLKKASDNFYQSAYMNDL